MSHGDHHHHHHHHHHHQDQPASEPHHEQGDQHHHDFFEMEDFLRQDFELKKDKLVEFLKKAGLKEGQRVLEIGCGFAPLLELYCDTVGPRGSVTLTDPEARLADRLAPRLAGRPNVRFVAGRAEDLLADPPANDEAAAEAYDLAVMVNVYHHLSDPEAVLAAVRRRLLSSGGRLVVLDFVHDTFRVFASASASPAAAAAQARLAGLIRPEASPVTGLCATRMEAAGFRVRLSESYVMHDRFNGTPLGDFYARVFLPHSLDRLARRSCLGEAERAELLADGLAALRTDPDAVLFSEIHVMLAADA